jgi:hypothetical protein
MGRAGRCPVWGNDTQYACTFQFLPNNLDRIYSAVSDTAEITHGDGDDVENGPRREGGYALLSGDAVSVS